MTIAEFLATRIAEDEASARQAEAGAWRDGGTWWLEGVKYSVVGPNEVAFTHPSSIEHIIRHDPARVLADCAAKRAIVNLHNQAHYMLFDGGTERIDHPSPSSYTECHADGEGWPCLTLRHLATAYANHPDYNEEWKP